jgi:hypothetical protein
MNLEQGFSFAINLREVVWMDEVIADNEGNDFAEWNSNFRMMWT